MDPITFEVIRNALVAATDEMVLALRRSAYSTNIKTRSDFSCAFFDAELRSVAQGFTQPVHLGSMVEQVPRAVRDYGPENLGPGDVLDHQRPLPERRPPERRLADLAGAPRGRAARLGGEPRPPRRRRRRRARVDRRLPRGLPGGRDHPAGQGRRGAAGSSSDVFDLILAQIRSKHETAGDFRAQIAANTTGVRRLQALADRHGRETLVAHDGRAAGIHRTTYAICDRNSAARGLRAPRAPSTWTATPTSPCSSRPGSRSAADGVAFDLAGSDPQRRAPVNSTYAQTFSACAYALKCLVDPDLPVNDGFYRLVTLDAPLGSVTNCTWPSPVVGGWETQTRLVDVIFRALLPVLPERLPAGTKAMMCHAGFGGVDPQTNAYYCFLETFGGGYGARFASDGPDAVQTHGQNTENAPVEETELNYPVRVTRLSLVEDSDGPGRFRGGLGLRKDFLFDRPTTFTVLADRTLRGPAGAFGGGEGAVAEYVLIRDGRGEPAVGEDDARAPGGRHGQLPHLRRRRLRAARRARPRARRARRARGQGQPRAGARRCTRVAAVDPDHLRGDPERARGGDRRDGAGAEAQRVLDEHQDALRLLLRVLRRRAAAGRAGLRAAGAPRLDGRAGAEGGARVRRGERSAPATRSSPTTRTRAAST